MAATAELVASAPRPGVGTRLLAGRPFGDGPEGIDEHERRLGKRPIGAAGLIELLARSGLRGRGGAWFPTHRKWAAVARSSQGNAVVVINASEGEPLSSKDRTLLTYRPHVVLDGAALAAEALGATDVVLYLSRGFEQTGRALEQALRERVRASVPELPVRIVHTAHRYIAGESSAVINRVSGGVSKPRFSLQRAAEKGVDDRPTLVQNVETIAHVAMIARYGSDWFRKLGTEWAPGSMLMTMCGNVKRPGVYEVALGARLGAVVEQIGGTIEATSGALLGGYFGTWLPATSLAELALDPDTLRQSHGASLGCGVVAILPRSGCGIVESTRILSYLAAESAGQCGPCVNGLSALSSAMTRIANSQPEPVDIERVRRWIRMVRDRGACHHPDGAVGQLSSALTAFEEHLDWHLAGRRCPGVEATGFPPPPAPGNRWR
jgi:NADH:ubiquinone oxidoreductase subunit F (NADH-binding)